MAIIYDFQSVLRTLGSLLSFLFYFMQDITKCEHFASTYMKEIQSFNTVIMNAKRSKLYASFFLISLDERTSQP